MSKSTAYTMHPTKHAQQRWGERFPGLNMYEQYQKSNWLGKKRLRRIVGGLGKKSLRKLYKYGGSCYLLWTPQSGAVFVMDKGAIVITVLRFPND